MENVALRTIRERIDLIRKLCILLALFSVVVLVAVFIVPNALPTKIKIWLGVVTLVAFGFLTIALFLVKQDSTSTLALTHLVTFISELVLGITIIALAQLSNGSVHG